MIKAWLIIGGEEAASLLPITLAPFGTLPVHSMPTAGFYSPGQFIVWQSSPTVAPVTLVCVELPMAVG